LIVGVGLFPAELLAGLLVICAIGLICLQLREIGAFVSLPSMFRCRRGGKAEYIVPTDDDEHGHYYDWPNDSDRFWSGYRRPDPNKPDHRRAEEVRHDRPSREHDEQLSQSELDWPPMSFSLIHHRYPPGPAQRDWNQACGFLPTQLFARTGRFLIVLIRVDLREVGCFFKMRPLLRPRGEYEAIEFTPAEEHEEERNAKNGDVDQQRPEERATNEGEGRWAEIVTGHDTDGQHGEPSSQAKLKRSSEFASRVHRQPRQS